MNIIISSKNYKSITFKASYAITMLNSIGISFSGLNLSNIVIPCANLTGGYF